MEYDFSNVPTMQLANDSLLRGRDLNKVTDALWDNVIPAWLGLSFGATGVVFGFAILMFNIFPFSNFFYLGAIIVIVSIWAGWKFSKSWFDAQANCRRFTQECDARTKELKKRNQGLASTVSA